MRKLLKLLTLMYAASMMTGCVEVIDTGHRGVEVKFGKVNHEKGSLTEDIYFYNPFTTSIIEMDTRILSWENTTSAYTKDVQQATVKYTINYRIDPTEVYMTYEEVGIDWAAKLMPQVIEGTIKEVIGSWEAEQLIVERDKAQQRALESIMEKLKAKRILISNFEFNDIEYTPEFEKAVEDKVIAAQKATEEANRTKQKEEQKTQAILKAEGEAESIRIRSEALKMNPQLVQLEAVNKWDGKLPVYMMGGNGAIPFISMDSMGGKSRK